MSTTVTSTRPQKPDEDEFKKNLSKAEAELKTVNDNLNKVRAKIDGSDGKGGSPKTQELKKQLDSIKEKQASIKGSKAKVFEQVRSLEESIKRKIADSQASKKKLPYKSSAEIDSKIAELEKQVDSGKLKLVDEKKYLQEISQLKRAKKSFTEANSSQSSIDAEKKQVEELRKQIDDPESKALSKQYDEVKAELDSLRGEQDVAYKSRQKLYDERNSLSAKSKEIYLNIKGLKDTYYQGKKASIAYEKDQRQKRYDAQKAERDAYEKQKRLEQANKKMEEAREPAYEVEIMTCNNLIRYFDPTTAGDVKTGGFAKSFAGGRTLDIRSVEAPADGVVLQPKKNRDAEESYFVGGKGKKKGVKAESKKDEKFNLSIGTIQELGTVNVQAPLNASEVPSTVEKLKEKLDWYKSHQAAETEKRVAKAQKEVDALNAAAEQSSAPETNGASKKTADTTQSTLASNATEENQGANDAAVELEKVKLEDGVEA
ncbi:Putative uncharacterized protein [Taphrina deformans PYCC 5710]|uniref:Nuclear segregation protein n=1 Tax=Taphrina deformans (strain PYCC 5710 / ATCC 11124 / CBS 356.35 / IMI 108563 / JCM 9778 / NBRC 8474) TaxID=1097556 RepID=R4XCN8_TAPDE|nr:Putative uncharacterized protein [Taphrina deformans PYCC 5710]|eukprot:CCG82146.1 Putative uncharacterized protein [Taphrina deformans PYCC 5710]